MEMKTEDLKRALVRGDVDAGILAQLEGLEEFDSVPLFYEQFFAYVAEGDPLFGKENIKTADLTGGISVAARRGALLSRPIGEVLPS